MDPNNCTMSQKDIDDFFKEQDKKERKKTDESPSKKTCINFFMHQHGTDEIRKRYEDARNARDAEAA